MAEHGVVTVRVENVPEVAAMLRVLVSGLRVIEARAAAGASAKELGQVAHRALQSAPQEDELAATINREGETEA